MANLWDAVTFPMVEGAECYNSSCECARGWIRQCRGRGKEWMRIARQEYRYRQKLWVGLARLLIRVITLIEEYLVVMITMSSVVERRSVG